MPKFRYTAMDAAGRQVAGMVEADGEAGVLRILTERQLFPVSVRSEDAGTGGRRRRVGSRDVGLMYGQLADALAAQPELKTLLGKLDDEDAAHAYSQFVSRLLAHALRTRKPEERLPLVNRLISLISATDGLDYLQRKTLLAAREPLLLSVQSPIDPAPALSRPETPLTTSSLLTGARHDPQLEH